MTDRQTLHQLIEELPASQLVAAEDCLTALHGEEVRQTLTRLGGELPLYDADFYTWTQEQAAAIRARHWPALDVANLAEEISDLGQSIENAIEHHLERLLLHLLKYRYDPAPRPRRGWRLTIRHARRELAKLIRKNPGLQHHPAHYLAEAYRHARDDAPDATGLPLTTFPKACPWPLAQVLDADFWPEEGRSG